MALGKGEELEPTWAHLTVSKKGTEKGTEKEQTWVQTTVSKKGNVKVESREAEMEGPRGLRSLDVSSKETATASLWEQSLGDSSREKVMARL